MNLLAQLLLGKIWKIRQENAVEHQSMESPRKPSARGNSYKKARSSGAHPVRRAAAPTAMGKIRSTRVSTVASRPMMRQKAIASRSAPLESAAKLVSEPIIARTSRNDQKWPKSMPYWKIRDFALTILLVPIWLPVFLFMASRAHRPDFPRIAP